MSVIYTLLIMFLFAKLIIRCSSRKSYIITGTIVALVVTLTDIQYIISNPKHYFIYSFWQIALAYVIYLVYVFSNTFSSKRNRDFNKKARKETKPYFNTSKANRLYLIITSFAVLLVGVVLLIIRLLDVYKDIPYVVYIGSAIGFIVLLLTGIFLIKTANEKFILLIKTDEEFYSYYIEIKNKFRFNYMDYIGDIYRYYIIEKIGVIKFSGDLKETHYVWILDTENLNNYDISKLEMPMFDGISYKEIINDIFKFRNAKINIEIKDGKIVNIK